ncbi:MAG: acyltransferase [Bacteroidaceae bacterium]|nr:acyltransferase [Bacteroidaceae bacterium]
MVDWIKKENVGWIDVLRIVAIFFVVFSHCCDNFIAEFAQNRSAFNWGLYLESIGRPCVVLMVMISGWLLLPIKAGTSLRNYYAKRIGRVIVPLIFWSLVLPVIFYVYFRTAGLTTKNPIIDVSSYTLSAMGHKMLTFFLNFNFDTTPLWFLYMLIGLYLVLPIVNAWLLQASKKDLRTVLMLWGVTLLIPYIRILASVAGLDGEMGFGKIFGECDWNFYGSFYYFSGFLGYMLLAYYLKKYPLQWGWNKTLLVAVPVYLAGYVGTSVGYALTDQLFPGDYKYLEIPWYMCGLNVAMQAFGVFIVFMKLKVKSRPWLSKMASMMFGVYLCHFPFVQITYDWFNIEGLPYALRIIAMVMATFVISYAITWALYSWKLTRRIVK